MRRKFNISGACIPKLHYMVDLSPSTTRLFRLVEAGEYLTISRPRQYGKTTTLEAFAALLRSKLDYLPLQISFEGLSRGVFQDEKRLATLVAGRIEKELARELGLRKQSMLKLPASESVSSLDQFELWIERLIEQSGKKVVLMIDEVDHHSNEELFFSFLGLLRYKYLKRHKGEITFQSVILVGVKDVKTLKSRIRPTDESQSNSPWNIAINYDKSMSFSANDIATMLRDYVKETGVKINLKEISERLYHFTSGYPFLVSLICKVLDEELVEEFSPDPSCEWNPDLIDRAVNRILKEQNTNFKTLIKNLEYEADINHIVYDMLLMGSEYEYNEDNPAIQKGARYGIFRDQGGALRIHNRIYSERIYNYLASKIKSSLHNLPSSAAVRGLVSPDGGLDFRSLLLKFQTFMKEEYTGRNQEFLERNGRLIFMAFLSPILNGQGFSFKEPQISEEKRLDLIVTYFNQKYVVELKLWYGQVKHEEGLEQLVDYLERQNKNEGYLVIFDFKRKTKEWKSESLSSRGKELFIVWV